MTDLKAEIWDVLVSLDSKTLLQVITDYHGMQILDDGFAGFLADEGLMEQAGGDDDDDDEEDEQPEGPGDDDYFILDCGPLGSKTAVCVQSGWADKSKYKQFDTEEKAAKAIKEDMAAQKYWPNVWKEDDHGGITPYNALADEEAKGEKKS
ncbi:MAG: hypothetical protein LBK13_02410 [Spirochaetales bacterium]|jgi:hypothetical protein|nr:hypothetical protein [Spirochaetales bacterium]